MTSQGGVEGFKPPVPFQHIGTDFEDLGDSKEDYRRAYRYTSVKKYYFHGAQMTDRLYRRNF